jgi:hypothetical protein
VNGQRSLRKDPRDRKEVSKTIAADFHRVSDRVGKGTFADSIGVGCTQTVNNAITGATVPELHTALNALLVDPAGLFQTLLLYGGVFVPVEASACDDMAAISQMLRAASEYFERMQDGNRDHNDTIALAELFRPLVPAMLCVIREAGDLRGLPSNVTPLAGRAA